MKSLHTCKIDQEIILKRPRASLNYKNLSLCLIWNILLFYSQINSITTLLTKKSEEIIITNLSYSYKLSSPQWRARNSGQQWASESTHSRRAASGGSSVTLDVKHSQTPSLPVNSINTITHVQVSTKILRNLRIITRCQLPLGI